MRPYKHNESVVTIEESDEENNEFISRVDVLSPRATFMRLSLD